MSKGEGERGKFAEPRKHFRDQVQFGWMKRRLIRRLGSPTAFGELGYCETRLGIHRHPLPLPAELMQTGHRRVTGARREESRRGAEICTLMSKYSLAAMSSLAGPDLLRL